jgi:hypothetical protein
MMRWVGHVANKGQIITLHIILVRNPKQKIILRIPDHKCEDNIKIYFEYTIWKDVDHLYTNQAHNERLSGTGEIILFVSEAGNFCC